LNYFPKRNFAGLRMLKTKPKNYPPKCPDVLIILLLLLSYLLF